VASAPAGDPRQTRHHADRVFLIACPQREHSVKLKITVENKTYEVDVEVAEDAPRAPQHIEVSSVRLPAAPSGPPSAAAPSGGGAVNEE
jgi:hypothetical protein